MRGEIFGWPKYRRDGAAYLQDWPRHIPFLEEGKILLQVGLRPVPTIQSQDTWSLSMASVRFSVCHFQFYCAAPGLLTWALKPSVMQPHLTSPACSPSLAHMPPTAGPNWSRCLASVSSDSMAHCLHWFYPRLPILFSQAREILSQDSFIHHPWESLPRPQQGLVPLPVLPGFSAHSVVFNSWQVPYKDCSSTHLFPALGSQQCDDTLASTQYLLKGWLADG